MFQNRKYVNVIIPLPIEGTFTYYASDSMILEIGQRVIVQFGSRKFYTGLVESININKPSKYEAKPILEIIDHIPVINSFHLKFWKWISLYYACSIGSVMKNSLPSSLLIASESKISINPDFNGETTHLDNNENKLLQYLSDYSNIHIKEVGKIINHKNPMSLIYKLHQQEILIVEEELKEKYSEKIIKKVVLIKEKNEVSFDEFNNAPKQKQLVLDLFVMRDKYPKQIITMSQIIKTLNYSRSSINSLVEKGIIKISEHVISRIETDKVDKEGLSILSDYQNKALLDIRKSFDDSDICLLDGVTSSGKTEVYIHLINEQIQKNKQVLFLLPEIALTVQIINRLKRSFGNCVGVYHSNMNNSERVEVWNAVKEKNPNKIQYSVILGVRSSIFLPFNDLGLIIIDEEHEHSYKNQFSQPRYHARDSAIYLAKIFSAKVLLGSATPSFESYSNVELNKFSIVKMRKRHQDMPLPKIFCVDLKKEYQKKQMNSHFSRFLINEINETINLKKQVILFQNRRGYSSFMTCEECGYVVSCKSCDVSLTVYKNDEQLRCNYCGYEKNLLLDCPSCNKSTLNFKGFGTEKLEKELRSIFPNFKIKRMDYDTTRKKYDYQKIITEFEHGRIDILIGTQMIAKGLDFQNVRLVGIINADNMLNYPDFRSHERAFQLMLQVSGRSGRKDGEGRVVIQTYNPNSNIMKLLKKHDYSTFVQKSLEDRRTFRYPPYNRLISVILKHKNKDKLDNLSYQLSKVLIKSFGDRVLGPEYPMISRIRNYYNKRFLLKIEHSDSLEKAKEILKNITNSIRSNRKFSSMRIIIDVDPV